MTASPTIDQPIGFTEPPESSTAHRRFFRSSTNRVFAGVCGGIAEHFGSDPTAVRLLTAVLAVVTGIFPMLILYLFAAVLVPERAGSTATPRAPGVSITAGQGGLIIGIIFVVVGVAGLANELFRVNWDVLWPVGLIAVGAAVLFGALTRTRA